MFYSTLRCFCFTTDAADDDDNDDDDDDDDMKVSTLADKSLQCRERDKFDQYIRDVDKVTSLLLKLSEMLARADNALTGLTTSASDTERVGNLSELLFNSCTFRRRAVG